jgi:beta-lactam-binding protein with PASTA domain
VTTTMTTPQSGTAQMPLVTGMTLSRARKVIGSVITNPQLAIQYRETGSIPPGMVSMQEPCAGCEVTPGSQIRLTVIRPE